MATLQPGRSGQPPLGKRSARATAILLACVGMAATIATAPAHGRPSASSRTLADVDERVSRVLRQMSQAEKLALVLGFATGEQATKGFPPPPSSYPGSAGYVPGNARLGLPPLWQVDSGIGVSGVGPAAVRRERVALPSGLTMAATWDPAFAERGGAMIGAQARASGFNMMLAGSGVLVREPRSGRNFENAGEDPLLNGVMTGAQIRGVQSQRIISTLKTFALNAQETGRFTINAQIAESAARTSDYLAAQIAIEQSHPGAVMCAYNKVNDVSSCENAALLRDMLKGDWGYRGFVLSDWGAVHSTVASANGGLDQQSGWPFDKAQYFGPMLADALADGSVPAARLDDMAERVLRAMFTAGIVDDPVRPGGAIDLAADADVSQAAAEAGMVLLKNDGDLLPLKPDLARVAVIGGHADVGVLSGGGSAQVHPVGGNAVPGLEPQGWPGPVVYNPSSPMRAIRSQAPTSQVVYADGRDLAAAAALARDSDVAVVFVTQWTTESRDTSLSLSPEQDALVAAVAAANPRTVVVVESGGAVLMPWLAQTRAVLQAWYPGARGGEAIARLLYGQAEPSGRLPISFPASEAQLPRPKLDRLDLPSDTAFTVRYSEGAAVGYKWHDRQGQKPLFPFGFGLGYTRFDYGAPGVSLVEGELRVGLTVRNVGARPGQDVPQVYVSPVAGGWEAPKRLAGWSKVALRPGEQRAVEIAVDPRLLATWSVERHGWVVAPGRYRVMIGASSADLRLTREIDLPGRFLPAGYTGTDAAHGQ